MTGRPRTRRDREAGQGVIEFAMLVPVFMLLLLGMLEFGFLFDHQLTLSYASREGARVGSALATGGTAGCSQAVDQNIVASVERVLVSAGSPIKGRISDVSTITIFKSQNDGTPVAGTINTWSYNTGGTAAITTGSLPAPAVQYFSLTSSSTWQACNRSNGNPADSIGVGLTYTYRAVTPLAGIMGFFGGGGWSSLPIRDKTVMTLNPTD
jgi:Flp pilus assembly protein TadG